MKGTCKFDFLTENHVNQTFFPFHGVKMTKYQVLLRLTWRLTGEYNYKPVNLGDDH